MSIYLYNFFKKMSLLLCFVVLLPVVIQAQPSWQNLTIEYLQGNLARRDGGYGWEDQHDSHLTPTYAAIRVLYNFGKLPANRETLIAYIKATIRKEGKTKKPGPAEQKKGTLCTRFGIFETATHSVGTTGARAQWIKLSENGPTAGKTLNWYPGSTRVLVSMQANRDGSSVNGRCVPIILITARTAMVP